MFSEYSHIVLLCRILIYSIFLQIGTPLPPLEKSKDTGEFVPLWKQEVSGGFVASRDTIPTPSCTG